MNDAAILERRYRWLLRWYPRWFRDDIEDEVLGVLMAGAPDGKRWPSAAEAADVLWSALRMRFRLPPPGSRKQGWSDAWAAFSVLAPVFLLVANLAVVMVPPYFLPVLAGWRWVALAVTLGSACYMLTGPGFAHYPWPAGPLTAAWYILETVALLASPGPRRGRTLLTWGHGAVLVLAVGAVKLSSLTWFVTGLGDEVVGNKPVADILLIVAAVLAVAAVTGPAALRQGGRMSMLMAALLYPYTIEFASLVGRSGVSLSEPTPLHLVILFLMPLVMAVFAVLIAARRRLASSDAGLMPGS